MSHSVIDIWIAVIRRLRATWRPIFIAHLAYTALGTLLLAPLTGVLVRLLISLSGRSVLADQDIAWFLLTPFGIASLVLVAAVLVAIASLAQASMMYIGAGHAAGRRNQTFDALVFAAARAGRILRFAIHLVARLLVLTAPFILFGAATAWLLLTDHDINYYLHTRPPAFWLAAVIVAVLLLAMLVVVLHQLLAWVLALPLVLFRGISPARSFAESARLTRRRRKPVLGVMAVWAVATLALGTLVTVLIQRLGSWFAPQFYDSLGMLVVVLGGLVALWSLASLLLAAFTAGSLALIFVELAEQSGATLETAGNGVTRSPGATLRWRITAPRFALLLLGGALIAAATGAWLINGIVVSDDALIVAHRGAAGKAPENTLAALRQAIADTADWIEIDVQESADGEIVVVHDSDFMKLAGVDLSVRDGTLAQIQSIDVGSWFAPEFAAERVPTLQDVLEIARGKARVVIELKYYGYDEHLEQRVVDVVEAAGMESDIVVMSLEYDGIRKIRELRPDWKIGLLSATAVGDLTRVDADFLAVNLGMASPGFVRRAQAAGKQVAVWTVNDPVSMSRMMSVGVDALITDEPEMAREVLAERATLSPVERLLVHTAVLFGTPLPPRTYRDDSP